MSEEEPQVTMGMIEEARERQKKSKMVVTTPLMKNVQAMFPEVDENVHLHLKMENMQTTGSFKIRGVVNQLMKVTEQEDLNNRKLITMSAGNYGKAFAFFLQKAERSGICVMPLTAPENRVSLIKSMDVEVKLCPTSEMESTMGQLMKEQNCVLCHSFDDLHLIAGHGTCSMEVLEEGLEPDVVVVCCGGGGLVSGIAAAFHLASKKPVRVYAVEPEGSNTMWQSMQDGRAVSKNTKSVASGLSPPCAGKLCYSLCRRYVEDVILVSDKEILQCMETLFARGIKAEPSGCAAMTAVLKGRVPNIAGKDVLVLITGGNVSLDELTGLLSCSHGS